MTDERAIIKLGLKTGAVSSHGKSVQVPIHSVYDSLGRLATASEPKARIKRYRIAICDAKFTVCDVTLILCRKFCDATFACKSAIIGYPCA